MLFIPSEIEEEGMRLANEYFQSASDDAVAGGLGKYIENHASDAYKEWSQKTEARREEKLKEGIRI